MPHGPGNLSTQRPLSLLYRAAKYLFFGEFFKKKLQNIFSNFFFPLKVQSFRWVMENNFIQMAAWASHAVGFTIGKIFKHIIDCVQLSFSCQLSLACRRNTYIWRHPTNKIVQRCQIAALRWPNDISRAADNAIFKNRAQNIECNFRLCGK